RPGAMAAVAPVAVVAVPSTRTRRRVKVIDDSRKLGAIRAAAYKIRPLQTRLGKPQPGDWLAKHEEPGQTFDEYVKSNPNRPGKTRTTLYIQPLGDCDPTQQRLIEQTADLLGRFYGAPVKSLDKIGMEVIPTKAR